MNGFHEVGRCRAPGSAPRGLAFDGTWLWYADGESRSLYALTQSGRVRRQFLLRSAPLGIAYYRRTVLVVSDAPRTLRFFRRDGVEVNRRPLPGIRGGLGGFDVRNDRMWLALDGVLEQRSLATGELVYS
ncbi:MAG TPA: hypothetical protein VJS68_01435, partial [Thermoplasmata archaeon]|nr:hypothetical protein [Thermoplasmata archaeon]